ncbi:hypothetical protein [Methylobacterium sp. Leaf108]|uniref:hypothetical protein n=1 Tax=Methylobacterium sp. Leaf108 TaxID=1736256 RepID=UPI00190FF508|nr:hypothetical protein [Methylobacterium sp. Leaf108]
MSSIRIPAKRAYRYRRPPGGEVSMRSRWRLRHVPITLGLFVSACSGTGPPPPSPTATLRERVAALALRQTDFGAISVIPVRFEKSRLSGPFEDGGRTLYCVSSRMKGRSFDNGERPKVVIRDEGGVLKVVEDEVEVCEGHRTEPFPELETLGNAARS